MNRQINSVLFGIVLLSWCSVFVFSEETQFKNKYNIAIIESDSAYSMHNKEAVAEMNAMFSKMGYFNLVERAMLQKILDEQKFSFSDLADESKSLEVGKLLSADLMVFTNILALDKIMKERTYTKDGKTRTKQVPVINAKLGIRIIDVVTGGVAFSETEDATYEGEKPDSELISECFREITDRLKYKIMNAFPRKAYIVKVDNKIITIDSGKSEGLYKGMRFNVIEIEPGIKHPVTGQMLPGKKKVAGIIKLSEVDDSLSEAKIIKGSGLKPGQFVESLEVKRPAYNEAGFNFASRPFLMNAAKFNLIYDDGYDDYPITLNQGKITAVPAIGVFATRFISSSDESKIPVTLNLDYLANSPISAVSMDILTGYEYSVGDVLKLNLGIGGSYTSISGKVGSVGVGNITGAHFMYGPAKEYIPEGKDIKLQGYSIGGLVQAGFSLAFSDNAGIRLLGVARFGTTVTDWTIETQDKEDKTVTLSNSKFKNLTSLPGLDMSGTSGMLSIYFRY